ncbi:MAG: 23S rRNA (pseudouridine(1915)-N(3))-methyltransferase RlmH [Myxococcota bacterium]
MILRLAHPGRAPSGPLDEAAHDYQRRLRRHLRVDEAWVRAERLREESPSTVAGALATEAERLLAKVGPRDRLVALAIDGDAWSSEDLARRLQGWMSSGARAVVFALGSAHGLGEDVLRRADHRWSLGRLTLPHDLARVVLWEQLYRASTILRGEPYHK